MIIRGPGLLDALGMVMCDVLRTVWKKEEEGVEMGDVGRLVFRCEEI